MATNTRTMTDKPNVGTGHMGKANGYQRYPTLKNRDEGKVRVWVPELKMSVLVLPGTDMAALVKRYQESREFNKKHFT